MSTSDPLVSMLARELLNSWFSDPSQLTPSYYREQQEIARADAQVAVDFLREEISSFIEEYAQDYHSHVGNGLGLCAIYDGDRCDITAALRAIAKKVRTYEA